jgi:hypothetical protein
MTKNKSIYDINELIKSRNDIILSNYDNHIYKCTFTELRNINNIETPYEQVNLNGDRVIEMINAFYKNRL